jgi:hypothetical protein
MARRSRTGPRAAWRRGVSLIAASAWSLTCAATASAQKAETTGYEPCHLLCSNEAGRLEGRSLPDLPAANTLRLRMETIYVSPLGAYHAHSYAPIADSTVRVFELLTAVSYRPAAWLELRASMPWEYNHTRGVALPSLHVIDEPATELAPAGVFASAHVRLQRSDAVETWLGLGYRLTSAAGTVALSASDVAENPDKGLEGLGVGTDDIYLAATHRLAPASWGPWSLSGGLEWHVHMLPRFERVYGTTTGYRVSVERELGSRWTIAARVAGFYTSLPRLDIAQVNALIVTPSIGYGLTQGLRVSTGLSSQMPGLAFNRNALQTVDVFVAVDALILDPEDARRRK